MKFNNNYTLKSELLWTDEVFGGNYSFSYSSRGPMICLMSIIRAFLLVKKSLRMPSYILKDIISTSLIIAQRAINKNVHLIFI